MMTVLFNLRDRSFLPRNRSLETGLFPLYASLAQYDATVCEPPFRL